ncbi:MAG: hypothetical protein Q8Q26_18710, partial [Pseudorhodobacter sp.]|nr:hypothetical protein [Pseudorhodobacter sp.]
HEVMVRVQEDLPARPLAIIVPEPRLPPNPATASDQPVPQTAPDQPLPTRRVDPAEQILRDVLGALRGNN